MDSRGGCVAYQILVGSGRWTNFLKGHSLKVWETQTEMMDQVLEGSWVVMRGLGVRLLLVLTLCRVLLTLLTTAHEPASIGEEVIAPADGAC